MTDLLDLINQLTQTHKKTVYTVDGFEIHDRPALLEQLKDAVFGGMETTGGSALKSRLPISEAAVDLHELIDQQIAEAWAQATTLVPGLATPVQMLTQWAAAVREDTVVTVTHPEQYTKWDDAHRCMMPFVIHAREEYLPQQLAKHWVDLISDFFDPERTAGIKAPCIQCGARKVSRQKDGETVLSDALVFRRDRDTGRTLDARCLQCGVVWTPAQFEFLAEAIGIDLGIVVEDAPNPVSRVLMSEECSAGQHDNCRTLACRCEHHIPATTSQLGPATITKPGYAHTLMVDTVTVPQPLTRTVCPICWTERSISGECMCIG